MCYNRTGFLNFIAIPTLAGDMVPSFLLCCLYFATDEPNSIAKISLFIHFSAASFPSVSNELEPNRDGRRFLRAVNLTAFCALF